MVKCFVFPFFLLLGMFVERGSVCVWLVTIVIKMNSSITFYDCQPQITFVSRERNVSVGKRSGHAKVKYVVKEKF